jgi:hypothetical protein
LDGRGHEAGEVTTFQEAHDNVSNAVDERRTDRHEPKPERGDSHTARHTYRGDHVEDPEPEEEDEHEALVQSCVTIESSGKWT